MKEVILSQHEINILYAALEFISELPISYESLEGYIEDNDIFNSCRQIKETLLFA